MANYNNSPVNDPKYIDSSIQIKNYPDKNYQDQYDANVGNFDAVMNYQRNVTGDLAKYAKTGIPATVSTPPGVRVPANPTTDPNQQLNVADGDAMMEQKFQTIKMLRSKLDENLRELYYTDNSLLSDSKMQFDTAVYSGVLWTVLATCALYYVFVKL